MDLHSLASSYKQQILIISLLPSLAGWLYMQRFLIHPVYVHAHAHAHIKPAPSSPRAAVIEGVIVLVGPLVAQGLAGLLVVTSDQHVRMPHLHRNNYNDVGR